MNIKSLFFMLVLASANTQILCVHTGRTRAAQSWADTLSKAPQLNHDTWRHAITIGIPTAALTVLVSQMIIPDLWTGFKMWLFGNPRIASPNIPVQHSSSSTGSETAVHRTDHVRKAGKWFLIHGQLKKINTRSERA